jgi:hypothetical protein
VPGGDDARGAPGAARRRARGAGSASARRATPPPSAAPPRRAADAPARPPRARARARARAARAAAAGAVVEGRDQPHPLGRDGERRVEQHHRVAPARDGEHHAASVASAARDRRAHPRDHRPLGGRVAPPTGTEVGSGRAVTRRRADRRRALPRPGTLRYCSRHSST